MIFLQSLKRNRIIRWIFNPYIIHNRNRINKSKSKQFLKHADKALKKLIETTDKLNVVCWLSFGTLLGAIRERDFLKHDSDIDVGMFIKDYSHKFEDELKKAGFKKIKEFEVDNKKFAFEQSWMFETTKIDIFYHFIENDKMKCHTFYSNNNNINILEVSFSNTGFKRMEFKNMFPYVPKDSHLYLTQNYGENYMIPNSNWNYIKDPKNIRLIKDKKIMFKEY